MVYYHLYLGEINAFDGEKIKGLEKENEDILVKSFKVDEVRQMLKEKKIINGVTKTEVGYSGGHTKNPTYVFTFNKIFIK